MASNNIAKAMTGFAGDVWKGMSKGVSSGKAFRVSGRKQATEALNRMKSNNVKLMKPNNLKATSLKGNATFGQKAGNFVGGGIRDTYKNIAEKDMKFGQALKTAHYKDGTQKLSKTKMAGTFVGVSAAGRIATGGGVMKDKNGNTNLIGIPFI